MDKLLRLQKRILRMVLDDYTGPINVLLRKAHTLSVYDRVNYNTVILVFKCIHNEYLCIYKICFLLGT